MAVTIPIPGIHYDNVSAWLSANVKGAVAPFTFEQIAGGHSNLTFKVRSADNTTVVLRRPPLGHLLASAHDMGREYKIINSLVGSNVPVPVALGLCDDPTVNDAPFYVMEFVDGHVIRDRASAETMLDKRARTRASESIVDTLIAIHNVDLVTTGLADLGRHEGYIERQLKRWYSQFSAQKTRELKLVDHVHDELALRIPTQQSTVLTHGDYRLDNCMVNSAGDVIAVLDWEICTLGDPLADLGLLMVYWTGPNDDPSGWTGESTTAEGFLNRADLAERYGRESGRDISNIGYYVAFAYWKLACIMEGVYARYLAGALGQREEHQLEGFKQQVNSAAENARITLEGLS